MVWICFSDSLINCFLKGRLVGRFSDSSRFFYLRLSISAGSFNTDTLCLLLKGRSFWIDLGTLSEENTRSSRSRSNTTSWCAYCESFLFGMGKSRSFLSYAWDLIIRVWPYATTGLQKRGTSMLYQVRRKTKSLMRILSSKVARKLPSAPSFIAFLSYPLIPETVFT